MEHVVDFGSLCASMPVRTVILRDPFSWLVSFLAFTMRRSQSIPAMVCDDAEVATRNDGTTLMSYHHASTITEEENLDGLVISGWSI